ncbi:MAG: hypothetical protein ABIJ34_07200 [archaeon]
MFDDLRKALEAMDTVPQENLPALRFNLEPIDHVAKILCNHSYVEDKTVQKALKMYYRSMSKSGEKYLAQITLLRALFRLDDDNYHERDKITRKARFHESIDLSVLEGAMHGLGEDIHIYGEKEFHYYLIEAAKKSPYNLNSASLLEEAGPFDSHNFITLAYGPHSYDDSLDDVLAQRYQFLLRIPEVQIVEGARDVAEVLVAKYNILNDTDVLHTLADAEELAYLLATYRAAQEIRSPILKKDAQSLPYLNIPHRLKWMGMLMHAALDNVLSIGQIMRSAGEDGYG